MKNLIIVTGGAGFVGSNLIELIIKKTKFKIISLDNYSSGLKKNHIKNKKVKYLKGKYSKYKKNLKNIKKINQFFILESFQEFIKVLKNLMNAINRTQLVQKQFLNFV